MISRRKFLVGSGLITGLAAATTALPAWMPRLAFAQPYNDPKGDVLISIFLRGGADALNMVVPHGEDAYYDARRSLAIPRPDANTAQKALDLDGFFGLHPALAPLLPIFQGGQMKAVHATGLTHGTRSHFEAMDFMERADSEGNYGVSTGWIARHLASLDHNNPSPVRGIGWGTSVQKSLAGAPSTVAMKSIIDYHLDGDEQRAQQMMQSLQSLYALESDSLYAVAESTTSAIEVVQSVGYENYQPKHAAQYPQDDFGQALRQTAALIRADVGLEVACIDLGGWDTHANQGGVDGTQARLLTRLAEGLQAFHQDMGADMTKVSLVIMSEFGRRLQENASRGTDHGYGGAMLMMGAGFASPQPVYTQWPTLAPDALENGDLAITVDYRDVLAEMLRKRMKNEQIARVFTDHTATDHQLFA